jgi:hypothetical protein
MSIPFNTVMIHQDPIGLRDLPLLKPDADGWPEIRDALEKHQAGKRQWRTTTSWLAIAASLVLAVLVTTRQVEVEMPEANPVATQGTEFASLDNDGLGGEADVSSLISLSQTIESQLRGMRDDTGSLPASSAVYIAELEDLVAQVDNELSYSPDSVNLWGQRINLLLDLAQIYQHHWETEYGQMASL